MYAKKRMLSLGFCNWKQPDFCEETENRNCERSWVECLQFTCQLQNQNVTYYHNNSLHEKFTLFLIYTHTVGPILPHLHSHISNIFACTAMARWHLFLLFFYHSLLELAKSDLDVHKPLVNCGNPGFWATGSMYTVSMFLQLYTRMSVLLAYAPCEIKVYQVEERGLNIYSGA